MMMTVRLHIKIDKEWARHRTLPLLRARQSAPDLSARFFFSLGEQTTHQLRLMMDHDHTRKESRLSAQIESNLRPGSLRLLLKHQKRLEDLRIVSRIKLQTSWLQELPAQLLPRINHEARTCSPRASHESSNPAFASPFVVSS